MITYIQKWGNSLSLRIPKVFAAQLGIGVNAPVEITIEDGKLILSPAKTSEYSLEELLAQITEANLHDEIDTGKPLGNEVW